MCDRIEFRESLSDKFPISHFSKSDCTTIRRTRLRHSNNNASQELRKCPPSGWGRKNLGSRSKRIAKVVKSYRDSGWRCRQEQESGPLRVEAGINFAFIHAWLERKGRGWRQHSWPTCGKYLPSPKYPFGPELDAPAAQPSGCMRRRREGGRGRLACTCKFIGHDSQIMQITLPIRFQFQLTTAVNSS